MRRVSGEKRGAGDGDFNTECTEDTENLEMAL